MKKVYRQNYGAVLNVVILYYSQDKDSVKELISISKI